MAYLEVALVVVLILLNGLLAMSEMAIASSRPAKLKAMVDQGVNGSRRALALASDPARFLSTVQIGITLIGVVAGAFSGATLGLRVSTALESLGMGTQAAEALGFGTVIGGITYLSLVIGELVPKQLALRNPERVACLVAPAMTLLAKVSAPLVWVLKHSGRALLVLMGQGQAKDDTVTDSEIHALIAEAESAGVIEPAERTMITGVMRLGDRLVRTIMTPRADVAMLNVSASLAEAAKIAAESPHSRLVAYENSTDNIIGVIVAKDIAGALLKRKPPAVKKLVREVPVILETMDALDVVDRLKESPVHIGLVYDEYGQFEGVVTEADVLEAIVGAFKSEHPDTEPSHVVRADGSLLVAGWAPLDVLADQLGFVTTEKRDFQTVAGLVLDRLGHLPAAGEVFTEKGCRFEVIDMDGRRIDKILVSRANRPGRRAAG